MLLATVLVNAGLFGVIQRMAANPRIRLADTTEFDIANFIRMSEPSRDVRSRRDPEAPDKPSKELEQELSKLADAAQTSGAVGGLEVDLPRIDIDIDMGGDIAIARELTPLVRALPQYPPEAARRRIEGYVILRFTVTETGAVADPEIVRSDPRGVFERAAIRAVLRWKYQPQLVNGKPASTITYTRLEFEMEKETK